MSELNRRFEWIHSHPVPRTELISLLALPLQLRQLALKVADKERRLTNYTLHVKILDIINSIIVHTLTVPRSHLRQILLLMLWQLVRIVEIKSITLLLLLTNRNKQITTTPSCILLITIPVIIVKPCNTRDLIRRIIMLINEIIKIMRILIINMLP